jgi:hypothetical protein
MVRSRFLPLLMMVWGPGCAVTVHEQQSEGVTAPVRSKERFGDLISGPGQRVSMSGVPTPPEGPIPTTPPQPFPIQTPRAADAVPPPSPIQPVPSRPEDVKSADANPLLPPIFRTGPGPETPLLAATRAYQDGRGDFGQELLRPFPVANQDVLAKLLPAVARTAVANLNDPREVTDVLNQVEAAADRLRPRAELRVENLHVCSQAYDFGEYTPIPPTVPLHPGQLVKLYAEVKGAVPEVLVSEGESEYVFRFGATFRVRGGGKEISKPYTRKTRAIPRDIVVITEFRAPPTPGPYQAELELTDTAGRRARRAVEFRVDDRK